MYSNPDTHTGGPVLGFASVLQMDLTQSLVPSVAQTTFLSQAQPIALNFPNSGKLALTAG